MADTRKDKRAPVSLKVRFKSATVDEFIEHYSKDVSRGGIYIKSSQPMQVGTLLKFQFQLKDESALIRGVGRVVWTRIEADATADSPAGMGIKFIKMDNESRAVVERIVDSNADERGTYESGRYNATSAEPTSSAPPPSEGGSFFPDLPPAELPPPEDRTAVRQATQFLAAALTEGGTDEAAAREAQEKAAQARKRTEEIENQRRLEAEHKKQAEQEKQKEAAREQAARDAIERAQSAASAAFVEPAPADDQPLPSMIIDPSLEPRAGRPSEEARGSDATPLPRPHAALSESRAKAEILAGAPDEPDTEPPPAMVAVPNPLTTSFPHASEAPRKSSVLPWVILALLVLVAAFVALQRKSEDETDSGPAADALQDETLREVETPPPVVAPVPVPQAPTEPTVPSEPAAPSEPTPEQGAAPAPEAPAAAVEPVAAAELVAVQVSTTPKGAEVWLGEEKRGPAPLTLELAVGTPVLVRAQAPGYLEASQALTPTKKTRVRLKLQPTPWIVHVETTPAGAAINVGGHKGIAPVDLTLDDPPQGELSVNAKLAGYDSANTRIAPGAFSESGGAMRAQLSLTLQAALPDESAGKEAAPPSPKERLRKAPASNPVAEPTPATPAAEPSKPAAEKPAEAAPAPADKPAEPPAEKPAAAPATAKEQLPDNPFGD